MIRCIAVDDEPLALELHTTYIEQVPYLQLQATFTDPFEAFGYLKFHPTDLLFLDIQMPDISGLQFFKSLTAQPMVIFTTAYKDYAVEGFNLNAVDYLLKPFDFNRFLRAVEKARTLFDLTQKPRTEIPNESIFVYVEYQKVQVHLHELLYIEAVDDYIRLVTTSQPILTHMSLKAIQELLPESRFVRIHRSYIVAFDRIRFIQKNTIHLDGYTLPIGDKYNKTLTERISARNRSTL